MNTIWQFATAANIRFGRGCSGQLAIELQRFHVTRPMVITDKTIVNLPAVVPLLQSLQRSFTSVTVFDGCVPEPPIETAEAAIAVGTASGVDGIVASTFSGTVCPSSESNLIPRVRETPVVDSQGTVVACPTRPT